jgi:hypothetical protein
MPGVAVEPEDLHQTPAPPVGEQISASDPFIGRVRRTRASHIEVLDEPTA